MTQAQSQMDQLMTLPEHLGELKARVKVIVAAYVVSMVFWLLIPAEAFDPSALFTGMYKPMVSVILNNAQGLAGGRMTIIAGTLTAPLEIYFLASAIMSLITASPVIGYEIVRFVDPALKPSERSTLSKFMIAFVGLFVGGAAIGYFVLMPAIIRFMAYFALIVGAVPIITAGDYYGMVFMAVGAAALAFTTPAVFVLLVNFGIVSTSALTKNRLIVYLALYVLIAALTPEPVVGHFGMFFPIILMLEVSVLVGKRIERKRAKRSGVEPGSHETKCPKCSASVKPGTLFCPECGSAQG